MSIRTEKTNSLIVDEIRSNIFELEEELAATPVSINTPHPTDDDPSPQSMIQSRINFLRQNLAQVHERYESS